MGIFLAAKSGTDHPKCGWSTPPMNSCLCFVISKMSEFFFQLINQKLKFKQSPGFGGRVLGLLARWQLKNKVEGHFMVAPSSGETFLFAPKKVLTYADGQTSYLPTTTWAIVSLESHIGECFLVK